MNEAEKQAAIAAAQSKVDAALKALTELIAALTAAHGISVVPDEPVPEVPAPQPVEVPTSASGMTTKILAVTGNTILVPADNYIVKDRTTVRYPARTSHVVNVFLSTDKQTMEVTTSEPAYDKAADMATLAGKVITVYDRYAAVPVTPPPVVTPPVVETPAPVPTPEPPVPSKPGAIYLAGVNMGALNNNPRVDNSIARIGTNYRDVEQKYIDKYRKLGCKVMRLMIAPERCVDVNKGVLRPGHMAEIKSAMDRLAEAGIQAFFDPHSYMRLWSTVPANYVNKYGYNESIYGGVRKLWIPVGAPDCLMDEDGYADFLNKITAMFAGHPAFLGIGIANEPFRRTNDKGQDADPLNVVAQYFSNLPKYISAVSAASKTCRIFVGGGEYCTALNWPAVSNQLVSLADPYDQIVYEAHQYLDGKMYGGGQWNNRNEVIPVENGVKMVKPFVEWLDANGKRGIIGEEGFPAGNKSAAAATVKLLEYTSAHGVPVFQWCAGAGWSPDDVNAVDDDNMTEKDNLDPIKAFFGKSTTAYGKPGA